MLKASLVVAALSCVPLAAQSLVVDIDNGPGTDYTTIAEAVAAAPDGGVITVRAGNYFDAVTISQKSLTILGEPGARLFPSMLNGFRIEDLLPGQLVSVAGLRVDFTQATDPSIYCVDNLGVVALDDVATGRANLWVENCAAVTVRDSQFENSINGAALGFVTAISSVVTLESCSSFGTIVTNSTVACVDCTLTGAQGFGVVLGRAVQMNGGELRIVGGLVQSSLAISAITGTGAVRLDPATSVIGSAPLFDPGISVAMEEPHATTSERVNGGADVEVSAIGPAGSLGVVMLGLTTPALLVPGLDPLWLDPSNTVLQTFGVHAPGAPIVSTYTLPPVGAFTGVSLSWQSLELPPGGGLGLSTATTVVLR